MDRGLALVTPLADQDTVDALADLLDKAKRGEVVGVAYVALYRGCEFSADITGSVRQNPLLSRGIASTLWEQIPVHLAKRRP
jgi:hypothetical protein